MPRASKAGTSKEAPAPSAAAAPGGEAGKAKAKRASPLSQSDVPAYTLTDALRVAETLRDQFAKKATSPLDLAVALNIAPNGTYYKMLTGAAVAYGLTDGAA